MDLIAYHFNAGGWAMWVILLWLLSVLGITIERVLYLFGSQQDVEIFVATVLRCVESRNLRLAIDMARASRSPLGNIIRAGLEQGLRPKARIQEAMDERGLRELPNMGKRIPYLVLLANLSMLTGLFGTIVGLIKAFGAVGGEAVDPSQKARILAEGIAEAMNCTAFGLLSAIVALTSYALLNGWLKSLEDDIHAVSVEVCNALELYKKG